MLTSGLEIGLRIFKCILLTAYLSALNGGLVGKESTCSTGDLRDMVSFPELGRPPGGGHGNPLQYSCLEIPNGQRNLEDYSLWGHKELSMTEVTEHCQLNI